MSTFDKLIEIIKTHGRKDVGEIQSNSKGVRYQYVIYVLDNPFKWVVKTFEKAQLEVYGNQLIDNYRRISKDNYQLHCDYPPLKGQKPKSISMNELIILK